jgi:large subunit ribosomal protein L25
MSKLELKASKREEKGKKNKKLRSQGLIPAVVYGHKFKSTAISINAKEFTKKVLQSEAGRNLLFTLKVSDEGKAKAVPVITQAVDYDPLTDNILHVDFMHIVMDEVIKAKIRVELTGIPTGVKDDGGVLVHGLREIEVKCLPGDIPDKYVVDVSALGINDGLHVSDLKISKNVEVLVPLTEMIANVSPPTKEEEVAVPVPTPEEAAAAAEGAEGAEAVAAEEVKEKSAPGAAPAAEKPAAEKKEKKEKK